jgi:hypothetical protein
MSRSHESQPGNGRRATERHLPQDDQTAAEIPDDTLRKILEQTADSLARPEQVDPALQTAMVGVARQFFGSPITVDPVGAALLEAVLRVQFPLFEQRPGLLSQTARTIAATLLSDPTARLRVEYLWARLQEDAA